MSALGDTALTLPLAYRIKAQRPELRIGWLVGAPAAPLLRGLGLIDRLHIAPQGGAGIVAWRRLIGELRAAHYPLALDPQGISRSALLPWLAGIPERVGLAPSRLESRELAPWLLNRFVPVPDKVTHVSDRTQYLATCLGIAPAASRPCPLPLDPLAETAIARWWHTAGLGRQTLVMGIGAGWPTKIWPAERVARLAAAAARQGVQPLILWGPAERPQLAGWRQLFAGRATLAPATTIPEMLAVLRRACCYAGPDSAALHLAWLLGKPTFSWFGASDPARCAPPGPAHRQVAHGPHSWRRTALLGNPLAGLSVEAVIGDFLVWLDANMARDAAGANRGARADPTLHSGVSSQSPD